MTSSQFAAAGASGTDWRDTAKTVLEQLQSVKTPGMKFNLGFLYISDHLAQDAQSILNLFKSVTDIKYWVGTVGVGVFANTARFVDEPAIAAIVGAFDEDSFHVFNITETDNADAMALQSFVEQKEPMLVFTHGDPMADENPATALKRLEETTSGFVIGGLSSSRHAHMQFANNLTENGLSGVIFSRSVPVATTLSQGCNIIGPVRNITRGENHLIHELDGQKPAVLFESDLRDMAEKKLGADPDFITLDESVIDNPEAVPEAYKTLFRGEVLVGFPVSGSDQRDYLVRNIVGINDDGSMTVSDSITIGERMLFVHRDETTVAEDLCKSLLELRDRITKEHGQFAPKAALYVSCLARAFHDPSSEARMEIDLIHDILGDVPLAGFYAGGEINCARLYGYTGILTLFL